MMKTKLYLLFIFIGVNAYSFGITTYNYEISVHDTVKISLNICRACGYSWFWINKNGVTNVDSISCAIVSSNSLGGIDTFIWSFKGLKAGLDTIKLVNGRKWDTNTYDTAFVIVKVKGSNTAKTIWDAYSNVITAFPNPAQNEIRINNLHSNKALVEIFNSHGQLLLKTNVANAEPIRVSNFNSGVYVVKIRDGAQSAILKVLKQ